MGVQQGAGRTVNMLETVDNCLIMWSEIERPRADIIECYGIHDAGFLSSAVNTR